MDSQQSSSSNKEEIPSCSKECDSPTKDKLFDPSIDMLVNDFDDERTLEEEEALAAGEANDPSMELSNLEKEGNMPLEELLASYYNKKDKDSSDEFEDIEEEPQETLEIEQICEPIVEKERSPTPPKQSKLSILYEPIVEDVEDTSKNNSLISKMSDDEEEEDDTNGEDDDYQKFDGGVHNIMVGSDYQAQVPDGLLFYDEIPANDSEDKLLWNPQEVSTQQVEEYLRKAHEIFKPAIPKGTALRDDEDALYILQECGYNFEEALNKHQTNGPTDLLATNGNGQDAKWSEEECRNFEAGVRAFGKDFLQIQQHKVQTKTVGDLVQFYYLWKKTERHDVFANKSRLDKKKYSFHPGFTDFMERFLDDLDTEKSSICNLSGKSASESL